jgi:hypothetical protein
MLPVAAHRAVVCNGYDFPGFAFGDMRPIIERDSLLPSKQVQNAQRRVHSGDALVRRFVSVATVTMHMARMRRAHAEILITGMSFASTRTNS